jgi:hypothetical protein
MKLVTPKAAGKHELLFNKLTSGMEITKLYTILPSIRSTVVLLKI